MRSKVGEGFTITGKCNHPNRAVKGRGLCGSCYEQARRQNRLPGTPQKQMFVWHVVEELEFHTFTWAELERAFDRNRTRIANSLRAVGRSDLIDAVDFKSFGQKPGPGRKKMSK